MAHYLFDIEANGKRVHEVTKIHSLVLEDWKTGELFSCADGGGKKYLPVEHGLKLLEEAEHITAHNGIAYDVPVLRKHYPRWKPKGFVLDTLVISRAIYPHRKEADFTLARKRPEFPKDMIGKHSLEAWGWRLGLNKIDYDGPWDEWSEKMQNYCEGDVAVLRLLLRFLRTRKHYIRECVAVEHALATELSYAKRAGIPFDVAAAQDLHGTLAEDKQKIANVLKKRFGCWLAPKNGTKEDPMIFVPKRDNSRYGYVKGAPCVQLKVVEFNPTSRQHMAKVLQEQYGWEPFVFTDGGLPEVSEETLSGIKGVDVAEDFKTVLLIDKRIGQLANGQKAWLKLLDEHKVIHPTHHHNHARTHRGGHASPNITQVPKVKSPYGPECRRLFHAPRGWKQLGVDVSGLELRCLAHYLARYDGGAYVKWVLDGNVHEKHQEVMGHVLDYDDQKTWFYAYLYGSGDENLGSIVEPGASPKRKAKLGREHRALFEKNLTGLGYFRSKISQRTRESGWLRLIDGRYALAGSEHAALNTLLQGTGAVLCKYWIVDWCRWMTAQYGPQVGYDLLDVTPPRSWYEHGAWSLAIWAHDETQAFLLEDLDLDGIAQKSIEFIEQQQGRFNFRCPLAGEAKFGNNWCDTH